MCSCTPYLFVLPFSAFLVVFVNKLPWLPQCPLPVGGHFVTVAVGNQMANWALCHVTSRHRGVSQSGQAILLSSRPHRFRSRLYGVRARAPEGLFNRAHSEGLVTTDVKPPAYLHSINLSGWRNVCVCSSLYFSLIERNHVTSHAFMMLRYWLAHFLFETHS